MQYRTASDAATETQNVILTDGVLLADQLSGRMPIEKGQRFHGRFHVIDEHNGLYLISPINRPDVMCQANVPDDAIQPGTDIDAVFSLINANDQRILNIEHYTGAAA